MQQTESFEAVYKRLEETVRRLEEGGLTLDESIALYEEGMTLARTCQTLLDQAELKITSLQDLFNQPAFDDTDDEDTNEEEE
jgi:exodeoxyribonuclease VII small subunit